MGDLGRGCTGGVWVWGIESEGEGEMRAAWHGWGMGDAGSGKATLLMEGGVKHTVWCCFWMLVFCYHWHSLQHLTHNRQLSLRCSCFFLKVWRIVLWVTLISPLYCQQYVDRIVETNVYVLFSISTSHKIIFKYLRHSCFILLQYNTCFEHDRLAFKGLCSSQSRDWMHCF